MAHAPGTRPVRTLILCCGACQWHALSLIHATPLLPPMTPPGNSLYLPAGNRGNLQSRLLPSFFNRFWDFLTFDKCFWLRQKGGKRCSQPLAIWPRYQANGPPSICLLFSALKESNVMQMRELNDPYNTSIVKFVYPLSKEKLIWK